MPSKRHLSSQCPAASKTHLHFLCPLRKSGKVKGCAARWPINWRPWSLSCAGLALALTTPSPSFPSLSHARSVFSPFDTIAASLFHPTESPTTLNHVLLESRSLSLQHTYTVGKQHLSLIVNRQSWVVGRGSWRDGGDIVRAPAVLVMRKRARSMTTAHVRRPNGCP
ncbi:hypothetical protein F4859DRAFT_120256 [Xylaria cf. heliscus]|nr:hypothetical protein F4859DRAFT_120256 [Xylaria cf. heliscus]